MDKDYYLKHFLKLLIFSKILWIISIGLGWFNTHYNFTNKYYLDKFEHYLHLILNILTGILIISLYNHLTKDKVIIEGEVKQCLYIFGILLLLGNSKKIIKSIHQDYLFIISNLDFKSLQFM